MMKMEAILKSDETGTTRKSWNRRYKKQRLRASEVESVCVVNRDLSKASLMQHICGAMNIRGEAPY
jgi:hypothetical protein